MLCCNQYRLLGQYKFSNQHFLLSLSLCQIKKSNSKNAQALDKKKRAENCQNLTQICNQVFLYIFFSIYTQICNYFVNHQIFLIYRFFLLHKIVQFLKMVQNTIVYEVQVLVDTFLSVFSEPFCHYLAFLRQYGYKDHCLPLSFGIERNVKISVHFCCYLECLFVMFGKYIYISVVHYIYSTVKKWIFDWKHIIHVCILFNNDAIVQLFTCKLTYMQNWTKSCNCSIQFEVF